MLTLAEADAELQRLVILKKNHADDVFIARRKVKMLPESIDKLSALLSHLTADKAMVKAHTDERVTVGGRTVGRDEVTGALGKTAGVASADGHAAAQFSAGALSRLEIWYLH